MGKPVIVSTFGTAIGRSFKGALVNVASETLATTVLPEVVRPAGIDPSIVDDVIFAELNYGGGDLARYAAVATGMTGVPGQAVNRHCAGSLTAIANAAAHIGVGAERVIVAGGVQSLSTAPLMKWRVPGSGPEIEFKEPWIPHSHPETADAPATDMSHHRRLEYGQEARHYTGGDGRVGGALASACGGRHRCGQVRRGDRPFESRAARRRGDRLRGG